jgi:hypothetical protein
MAEYPKMSEQALLVYKSIIDQFDIIKKQHWATTNYAVLMYAAIIWVDQHVHRSQVFFWALLAVAIAVGAVATALLIWFQVDLGKLRKRAQKANTIIFSKEEREALGLEPYKHPYGRGWHVLLALIAVCLFGAGLVVVAVVLGPAADQVAK